MKTKFLLIALRTVMPMMMLLSCLPAMAQTTYFTDGKFRFKVTDYENRIVSLYSFASHEAWMETVENDLGLPVSATLGEDTYTVKSINKDGFNCYYDPDTREYTSTDYSCIKKLFIPKEFQPDPIYFFSNVLAQEFDVEEGNCCYKSSDGFLLSADGTQLYRVPLLAEHKSWEVPEGVLYLNADQSMNWMTSQVEGPYRLKCPASVQDIEFTRFAEFNGLLEIDPDNTYWECIDNCLISKEDKKLVAVYGASFLSRLIVPECVRIFGSTALTRTPKTAYFPGYKVYDTTFYNINSICDIILPEGLERIEDRAFAGAGCAELHLPASVKSIGTEILFCSAVRCLEVKGKPETVPQSFLNYYLENIEGPNSAYFRDWESKYERYGFVKLCYMLLGSTELVEIGDEPVNFDRDAFFPDWYDIMTDYPLHHLISHIENPYASGWDTLPSRLFYFYINKPYYGTLWVPVGTADRYAAAIDFGIWPKCDCIREIDEGLIVLSDPFQTSLKYYHYDSTPFPMKVKQFSFTGTYAVGDVKFDRFLGFRSADPDIASFDEENYLILHNLGETVVSAVVCDTEGREHTQDYKISVIEAPKNPFYPYVPNEPWTGAVSETEAAADAAFYTLQGVYAGTDPGQLAPGMYIRRDAASTSKVVIR